MKTTQRSASKGASKEVNENVEHSSLMKLFEDELKDIYWAEKALTKAIPKMIKNATSSELVDALENHLRETEEQVNKVERVFEVIDKKPVAKKCEAMAGLVKEAEEIMKDTEKGGMRDAGIISAAQKVEHYEIASYGTLKTFANLLDLPEAANILDDILEQEKNADITLTGIAESVNVEALEEAEMDEEE